ncbi:MAG: hypothetical protein KAH11_09135 [Rhodospirillales bacterium]|nr:hypothetical protein [Rhodospirillales bacterium]
MNIVQHHDQTSMPLLYVASINGDPDGVIQARLREVLASIEPAAVAAPDMLVRDNADFGRFDREALNQFLVDTGTDAVIWGNVGDDVLEIHTAIAPYPKVAHENRLAARFRAQVPLPVAERDIAVPMVQALAAALVEIARNRPTPQYLIQHLIRALEMTCDTSADPDQNLNVLETLSRLYALGRADDDDITALRRAIHLNTRLCAKIGQSDPSRLARVLRARAAMHIRLGYRTRSVEPVLDAVDTLSSAARHSTEDLDRARLDLLLADCKEALGEIRSDVSLLEAARDLLNSAVPFLYQTLAIEDWARAQSRLARINWHLGRYTDDPETGKKYANDAIDAVCEALSFYNARNFPFAWARIAKLKGEISSELGSIPGRVESLNDGITQFREVLSVYTREHAPLEFAITSAELAESLCTLAAHTNDPKHLKSAESCFAAALEVYRVKADPEADRVAARLADVRQLISAAV